MDGQIPEWLPVKASPGRIKLSLGALVFLTVIYLESFIYPRYIYIYIYIYIYMYMYLLPLYPVIHGVGSENDKPIIYYKNEKSK